MPPRTINSLALEKELLRYNLQNLEKVTNTGGLWFFYKCLTIRSCSQGFQRLVNPLQLGF